MRPVLGPVLSVVRAAAHADLQRHRDVYGDGRLLTLSEVQVAIGFTPAEQALAVPRQVTIVDAESLESRARTERRWSAE